VFYVFLIENKKKYCKDLGISMFTNFIKSRPTFEFLQFFYNTKTWAIQKFYQDLMKNLNI
jgi:hypothetical protein